MERGAGADGQKINYNIIKQRLGDLIYRLVYVFLFSMLGFIGLNVIISFIRIQNSVLFSLIFRTFLLPFSRSSQKFEDPSEGEAVLVEKYKKLNEDLTNGFRNLEEDYR